MKVLAEKTVDTYRLRLRSDSCLQIGVTYFGPWGSDEEAVLLPDDFTEAVLEAEDGEEVAAARAWFADNLTTNDDVAAALAADGFNQYAAPIKRRSYSR